jgi:predicted Rossmann fold flavoprotein
MKNTTLQADVIVAGGGAAGFFSAIHVKLHAPNAKVILLEKSKELLAKVSISGGGRCNVTHDCYDPKELITRYPRGGKELLGPFHRFQPADTIHWFESRSVPIKAEADGRMFPVSDDSADIVNALQTEADRVGVQIELLRGLSSAQKTDSGFLLELTDGSQLACTCLIIATGGNRASGGWKVASDLGHTIIEPVPSLFSFHVQHPVLQGLAGLSVDPGTVSIPDMNASQSGPLLITHKGISGPAVLKLSAWQAPELAARKDHVPLEINWTGTLSAQEVQDTLHLLRKEEGGKRIQKIPLFGIPRRLWERLCKQAGISAEQNRSRMTNDQETQLITHLTAMPCTMRGKTMNKDEFVTCGGVDLKEIEMKTFQSRLHPGLFFAGEVLNIDGVTGGFNFQAAWTGGYLAGCAAADSL